MYRNGGYESSRFCMRNNLRTATMETNVKVSTKVRRPRETAPKLHDMTIRYTRKKGKRSPVKPMAIFPPISPQAKNMMTEAIWLLLKPSPSMKLACRDRKNVS